MTTMQCVAAGMTALYGLVSIIGGVLGYVRASSLPSLIAGGVAGVLLLVCAFGITRIPVLSLSGAIVLSLLLVGRFISSLITKWENMTSLLRTTSVVMVVGGTLVLICAALALFSGAKPHDTP